MNKIKVLELFSGYGGGSFALSKVKIDFECIGFSDIEKCASYVYKLNHGENVPELGDVTKIDPEQLPDFDLLTAGWPCQSFSLVGNREGFLAKNKGKLFFEIIRILKIKKPRYFLGENVQGILSHDNGMTMQIILNELKECGYYVKWKLLYSKEHGTPQLRPRVWFACFREKDDYNKFMFPEPEPLKITVKDLLEPEVNKKYYLTDEQIKRLFTPRVDGWPNIKVQDKEKECRTFTSHMSNDKIDVSRIDMTQQYHDFCVADFRQDEGLRPRQDNIAPTLCARKREDLSGMPIIMNMQPCSENCPAVQNAIKEGRTVPGGSGTLTRDDGIVYTIDTANSQCVNAHPIICDDGASERFKTFRYDGCCQTLKSSRSNYALKEQFKQWRRLTPRECFRLQGFFDDEIKFGDLSDSKLYFLAGNGWDINVASKIFSQMFKGNKLNRQKTIFELMGE
jgi:DNA-cytosine methyltransferase